MCQPMYKKIKCTLVQALRLCTGRTVHRGSRGIALLIHDHGTRRRWGVSVTPWPLFTSGKDPVSIVQEAGWAPGPVWTGAENLAFTGIRSRTVQPVASRYTGYVTRPTLETSMHTYNNARNFMFKPIGKNTAFVSATTICTYITPYKLAC